MNGPKIILSEFGNQKLISLNEIKNWFPSNKFDKRNSWEFVKKWIKINEDYLDFLDIIYRWDNDKGLTLEPSNKIGLIPLRNPYGGHVYGSIVVKPKIGWIKISEILDSIDWKLKPTFLNNEEPLMSQGVLPRWIKAFDTLKAIEKSLQMNFRGIKYIEEVKTQPAGKINWFQYSMENIPKGKWNKFNSEYVSHSMDIDVHRQFKGVIEQIKKDLLKPFVPYSIRQKTFPTLKLLDGILEIVKLEIPNINKIKKLKIPSFYRHSYDEAILKVLEYLSQTKFSIDSSEYSGLPWSIEMDKLFEYWIEFWCHRFSRFKGANFYSDIKGSSKIKFLPIGDWNGLQNLKPDIIIEKGDLSLIIDAKYKKHLMYIHLNKIKNHVIEDHRRDIHQILAYTSSSHKKNKRAILIYPQILKNSIKEEAKMINYGNSDLNINLIKIDTTFDSNKLLNKLDLIWLELINENDSY